MTFTLEGPARPVFGYLLLALCGTVGTVGYGKLNAAEHDVAITRAEADNLRADRNRFEDAQQHCVERQLDLLRGPTHAQ